MNLNAKEILQRHCYAVVEIKTGKFDSSYAGKLESCQPLGISSYVLSKLIPEEFRGSMPTIEEIEAELNE